MVQYHGAAKTYMGNILHFSRYAANKQTRELAHIPKESTAGSTRYAMQNSWKGNHQAIQLKSSKSQAFSSSIRTRRIEDANPVVSSISTIVPDSWTSRSAT